jgi:superfamily II DNA or RNA helicase
MSRITPLPFQEEHIGALLARLRALQLQYQKLGDPPAPEPLTQLRRQSACVMLQAPTGIGKTLIACEVMARFSTRESMLWFWFAPFAGIIDQAQAALKQQAPRLAQLQVDSGRRPERLEPGAVFVLTWQTVAARSRDSRIARTSGDAGLALDELVTAARLQGLKIGVIVDEAHHGFVRAPAACEFFGSVLAPDYVLMMTATPRDQDAERFSRLTGYRLGGPGEWSSITRAEGVDAQLLKRSVKAARFLTKSQDDVQIVSFEEVALSECAALHRRLQKTLRTAKVGLTPLMLVQVPNGGAALTRAREYLVNELKFSPDAVKVHTADEPDPNLAAAANDPAVDVILFKMAIATGFDAPRAYTLAALRGARDVNFGIQVVGRIMRVHRLLQGRLKSLPPELAYGYVFLANSEAQEGLVGAAAEINRIPEHLVAAGTSSVVTVFTDHVNVQCVEPGDNLTLPVAQLLETSDPADPPARKALQAAMEDPAKSHAARLFADLFDQGQDAREALFAHGKAESTRLTKALTLDTQHAARQYRRRPGTPASLVSEVLPELPDDFEEELAVHIEFSPKVLADRLRTRSQVVERTTDLFEEGVSVEDKEIWAKVSPALIAEQAQQLAFQFDGVDRRSFHRILKKRFQEALLLAGHEPPATDEELVQQLELILVRNPTLVRDAYKRVRSERVQAKEVPLPPVLESEFDLEPAAKSIYGVFPPDLSPSERDFAEVLDTADDVVWWHRNPSRKPTSVALYEWHDGVGFFPDFVVGVAGRKKGDGAALAELKGPQLLEYDRLKAGAEHLIYGRVYMIGKETVDGPFRLWRLVDGALVDDGPFEVQRLRYS